MHRDWGWQTEQVVVTDERSDVDRSGVDRAEGDPTEAFGAEFEALMTRVTGAYESLVKAGGGAQDLAQLRRHVAETFAGEVEDLIARHSVSDAVGEYVRHVVREGFDADFDQMDPTEESLRSRDRAREEASWTTSTPTATGAYAIRRLPVGERVEVARFERHGEQWVVSRWGLAGTVQWSDLERDGWARWSDAVVIPRR